ncbi:MAG: hypothetical protein K2L51_02875, partial [Clostridiales bacterium]|nr:hypothetical protein [Clostridiales bacterium]
SYTCYHAAENAARLLREAGFIPQGAPDSGKAAGTYKIAGGSLFAVKRGESGLQLALSHTDSPSLRICGGKTTGENGTLAVEKYGGVLLRSFLDRKLKIAGRVIGKANGTFVAENVCSDFYVTVPSLAVHLGAGSAGEELSVWRDMRPLTGACENLFAALGAPNATDGDLFCVPAEEPFNAGAHGAYLCAPRIDNLASVYAQVRALIQCRNKATCAIACFNNEETGSETREGAAAGLLRAFVRETCGENADTLLANAFALSCDGAHALHPSHPEKYGEEPPVLGGGVAIKRNDRYASDALTAAVVAEIFARAGEKTQTYLHHPDMRCGSTIGLTAARTLGCRVCDIGVPQLSMHAAIETAAHADLRALEKGLTGFFERRITVTDEKIRIQ